MQIEKLKRVPIRELWKHEEHGFTKWLEGNPDVLTEVLGFPLEVVEREKAVGSFKVDLVAQNQSGDLVIIENQLEQTNHDHLGKILTYATNLEAKGAVWIVTHARPEHVTAINWLNESTPADMAFYILKLEGFRIGDSPPAPLLTLIAGPSVDSKAIGQEKKVIAERHTLRLRFWELLLQRAKERGLTLHSGRSPSKDLWIGAGAGRAGFSWTYLVWMDGRTAVELYIDTGDGTKNKKSFDALHAQKENIEAAFGHDLEWERLDDKRGCRIRYTMRGGGLRDPEENWPAIHSTMVDAMGRFAGAIQPHLSKLK